MPHRAVRTLLVVDGFSYRLVFGFGMGWGGEWEDSTAHPPIGKIWSELSGLSSREQPSN